jgi:hypothetical protein
MKNAPRLFVVGWMLVLYAAFHYIFGIQSGLDPCWISSFQTDVIVTAIILLAKGTSHKRQMRHQRRS